MSLKNWFRVHGRDFIMIISLFIALYGVWSGRVLLGITNELSDRTDEVSEYVDSMQNRYVDIRYGYSTFDADTSYHTLFSFSNRGTIPATDVRIRLTYPAGTEIQKIYPPMKYTESEDSLVKIVELEIQRLDIYTQLSILVTSSHEPIAPPEIQSNEQTATQPASDTPS